MPRVTKLKPDVLIVTGDHSTPSFLKSHSWHPVPTLLVAPACRTDACQAFSESEVAARRLGPVRGQIPDAAGAGQCRPVGKVRGVRKARGTVCRL